MFSVRVSLVSPVPLLIEGLKAVVVQRLGVMLTWDRRSGSAKGNGCACGEGCWEIEE